MSIRISIALAAAALTCSLTALPAQAQRARVFVASYGTDSGNTTCSFTQPCRTFQNAVANVAAGGEVTAIDSAGFGPISITQSVTITSPDGVEAGIVTTGSSDTIDIINSGATISVVLRGLTLEGNGSATYGVYFNSGGGLQMIGCKVHNFHGTGIYVAPSGETSVVIKDSIVSDIAGGDGIAFIGVATILAALNEVTLYNNGNGIRSFAQAAPIDLQITNSHIDNSAFAGLIAGSGPLISSTVLKNVTINQSQQFGIVLQGHTSTWLTQVTQGVAAGFSNTGISFSGGTDTVYSDGTNHIMGALSGGSLSAWPVQ